MLNETSSLPTRVEQKQRRRQDLLRAALTEFNEKGFHGASTRAITAAAGISSGLLFHYFASKEELYDELVRIGCGEFTIDADAAAADPLRFLRGEAEHLLALLRATPEASAVFTFMARAERHPGITAASDALLAEHELVAALAPVVEAGQRAGVVRPGDPRALALAFWSALQGVAEAVAGHPDVPLPEADWLVAIVAQPREER